MGRHRWAIVILTESKENYAPLIGALIHENITVRFLQSERAIFDYLKTEMVDLILLDDSCLKRGVLDVARALLYDDYTRHLPIIVVSSSDSTSDIVSGFEVGIADYVIKPFNLKVFVARIRAAMRRVLKESLKYDTEVLQCGKLFIHMGRMEVKVDGVEIHLTLSEFRLLVLLATKPGWVYSREQIIQELGGNEDRISARAVDVLVVCIRRKLLSAGKMIQTVRSIGYRLERQ